MFLSSPYVSVADDARFKHFVKRILPRLRENPQPGALVFVRSYFDFVRVRNLLTSEDVSFAVVSEYTPPKDAARARSIFADGRKRVLLITERAHFYFRRRVRGRGRGFSFCGRFFFTLFSLFSLCELFIPWVFLAVTFVSTTPHLRCRRGSFHMILYTLGRYGKDTEMKNVFL